MLEFDQAGNLLRHWGGPGKGYEWPDSNHGIFIDYKGNVWIGGNGGPDFPNPEIHQRRKIPDAVRQDRCAPQGGRRCRRQRRGIVAGFAGNSNDPIISAASPRSSSIPRENEAYIADGYLNKRVAVIDADTGKMKRWWGAYGNKPDDTPLPPMIHRPRMRSSSAIRCIAPTCRSIG